MASTLLLRCCGPMQSWGTQSRFTMRDTGREPSKSGIIGLLCAALGRPRTAPLDDLAGLRMGVRADAEGRLERDFHTAGKGGYYRVDGKIERKDLIVSNRYYLADACFLVGLEGDDDLLSQLYYALANPVWMIFLGRRAFVPSEPPWLAEGFYTGGSLEHALSHYPYLGRENPPPARLRMVIEDPDGSLSVNDIPLSFVQQERRFYPRRVRVEYLPLAAATTE